MSSVTYHRRVGKTGRPLGILDVLSKIAETAVSAFGEWSASRREARLAEARAAGSTRQSRDAAAVRQLADRYRRIAPSFAADLYAAADQHEILSDG